MRTELIHTDLEHAVAACCNAGHPAVLACRPVRTAEGRFEPFPTTHWLACPDLDRGAAELERLGWIARIEARVAADPALRAELAADHAACARERIARLTADERAGLVALGRLDDLAARGIGGVRDHRTVKCLHAHLAWHLCAGERGGAVGRLLAAENVLPRCGGAR